MNHASQCRWTWPIQVLTRSSQFTANAINLSLWLLHIQTSKVWCDKWHGFHTLTLLNFILAISRGFPWNKVSIFFDIRSLKHVVRRGAFQNRQHGYYLKKYFNIDEDIAYFGKVYRHLLDIYFTCRFSSVYWDSFYL